MNSVIAGKGCIKYRSARVDAITQTDPPGQLNLLVSMQRQRQRDCRYTRPLAFPWLTARLPVRQPWPRMKAATLQWNGMGSKTGAGYPPSKDGIMTHRPLQTPGLTGLAPQIPGSHHIITNR